MGPVVDNGNFPLFRWLFFSDTLYIEMKLTLLYRDTQSVVGFSVIPKSMTLNDPDWLFHVKFCFRAGLAGFDCATFEKSLREN